MPLISHPEPPRAPFLVGSALLAVGLLILLVAVVPFGALFLPLEFSQYAWWAYVAAAIGVSGLLASRAAPVDGRRVATLASLSVLVVLSAATVGGCRALDLALGEFSVTTTEATSVSPSRRLVVTHVYSDQGALGADSVVAVHGRLVPGIVSWAYRVPVPDDEYPQTFAWRGERELLVDGRTYVIPEFVVRCSW